MKRTTLILLTAFYLLSCVGMGINRFYCCGKLASVTLTYGEDNTGNVNAKKQGCCKHEKQSLKVKDSHLAAVTSPVNHPSAVPIPHFAGMHYIDAASLLQARIVYRGNAPPDKPAIPVYTLNCAYRI